MAQSREDREANGEKRRGGWTARSVLHAVKRRPLALLGVVVLAAGVGAAVWFFLPLPKSTAAVVFHVAPVRPSLIDPNGGGGDGGSYRQSQTTLIKRRLTLNAVLNQQKVQQLEVIRKQPDQMAWLEAMLKVEARANNDFIRVTLEGDPPDDLRTILEVLSKAYLADVDERDNGARRDRLRKLEETNRAYRAELDRFNKRITDIAHVLGSTDGPTLAAMDAYVKEEFRAAQRDLAEARNNLQLAVPDAPPAGDPAAPQPAPEQVFPWFAPEAAPAPAPVLAGAVATAAEIDNELRYNPTFREREEEVRRAKESLNKTKSLFEEGARTPAVIQAEERLTAAEQNLDKYRTEQRATAEAAVRKRKEEEKQPRAVDGRPGGDLKRREALAKARVESLEKELAKSSEYRLDLENLRTMIGQTEKLSTSLGETIERLRVDLGAPSRVTLADDPHVVTGLEGNRRMKFSILAALAMLVVGFATVVGWEHRSRRFTHSTEVPAALGLRLIGSVPALGRTPETANASHPVLVEAIDATRTMLVHGTDQPDLRVVVVTSAVSGEGKTSLTGHLAISLARAGYRTLIVDGDLRAPTAQELFNVPLGPGFCELLEGRVGVAEAVRPTGVPGLSVLTAGEWTAATRQSLVGDRWRLTKELLKAEFDYVVVDTSPLLLVSDSLLLAREADGVVVSVLLGVSQVALVEEAVARLQTVRARLTGVIANGSHHAAREYAHGYRNRTGAAPIDLAASGRA